MKVLSLVSSITQLMGPELFCGTPQQSVLTPCPEVQHSAVSHGQTEVECSLMSVP